MESRSTRSLTVAARMSDGGLDSYSSGFPLTKLLTALVMARSMGVRMTPRMIWIRAAAPSKVVTVVVVAAMVPRLPQPPRP